MKSNTCYKSHRLPHNKSVLKCAKQIKNHLLQVNRDIHFYNVGNVKKK